MAKALQPISPHAPARETATSPLYKLLATAILQHRELFLGTDYARQIMAIEAIEQVVSTVKAQLQRRAHLAGLPSMPLADGGNHVIY